MNCWHCKSELIWGGDDDLEDECEEYSMVSNLHCPECACFVQVYFPKDEEAPEEAAASPWLSGLTLVR